MFLSSSSVLWVLRGFLGQSSEGSSSPNTGATDTRQPMLYTIYNGLSRKNPFPEKSISGRVRIATMAVKSLVATPLQHLVFLGRLWTTSLEIGQKKDIRILALRDNGVMRRLFAWRF